MSEVVERELWEDGRSRRRLEQASHEVVALECSASSRREEKTSFVRCSGELLFAQSKREWSDVDSPPAGASLRARPPRTSALPCDGDRPLIEVDVSVAEGPSTAQGLSALGGLVSTRRDNHEPPRISCPGDLGGTTEVARDQEPATLLVRAGPDDVAPSRWADG